MEITQKDYELYKEVQKKLRKKPSIMKILTLISIIVVFFGFVFLMNEEYDITGRVVQRKDNLYSCSLDESGVLFATAGKKLHCEVEDVSNGEVKIKIINNMVLPELTDVRIDSISINNCKLQPDSVVKAGSYQVFSLPTCKLKTFSNEIKISYSSLETGFSYILKGEIRI
ncbi:hypothetical protein JW930_02650 [Candidatus Woesearchaeota archaeon]|nr:hypothetical protein [Candidatus Woesearchaeota archaeon]